MRTPEEISGNTARQERPENGSAGGAGGQPDGVRRAVTLPAASGDPAAALTSLRPGQTGGTAAASEASVTAAHISPSTVGQFGGAVRALPLGATTGRTAPEEERESAAAPDAAAPVTRLATTERERGESALAVPATAGAGETAGAVGAAQSGSAQSDPAQPATDGAAPPGRPNKPMLAAAALAGVVLLGLPILMIGGDGDDEEKRENVSNAAQDTLLGETGEEQPPSSRYAPSAPKQDASKKPSADPSAGLGPQEGPGKAPDGNKSGNDAQQDAKWAFDKAAEPASAGQRQASQTATEKQVKPSANAAASAYWETKERKLTSAHTGKCLTTVNGRSVGQGSCGSSVWTRYVMPGGMTLLKLKSANQCLDTDGSKLYVSPCTAHDSGQVWRAFSAGDCKVALQASGGAYVTAWNNGTVSMHARGDVDVAAKQKWGMSIC